MTGYVAALHLSEQYTFSKASRDVVDLVAGMGVAGDVHYGATVRHRSRVAADPTQPNLRQVHLMPSELFVGLAATGFTVQPGDLGENITTTGIDLHALPTGTLLRLGGPSAEHSALVCITGLRNPCGQIEGFESGLLEQVRRDGQRTAGVMAVVVQGGSVSVGAPISVQFPPPPHLPLERV